MLSLLSIGGRVLGLFSGNGALSGIATELGRAYRSKLDAENDTARLAAEQTIKTLEAKRDVLVAEAASGGPAAWIRPLLAMPFVIYVWKLVVWDKVLAMGATDALSPQLSDTMMLVIGTYFLGRTAEKVTRIVKRR